MSNLAIRAALLGGAQIPSWVVNRANPPDLMFDFTLNKAWSKSSKATVSAASLLTVSRASSKYAVDSAGNWSSFGNNLPAWTDLGLSVEEARTNSIRNNSMQGAVAGTPGATPTSWSVTSAPIGLSRSVAGVGTQNGIDYIDLRYTGVATGTYFDIQFDVIPASLTVGQAWDASVFCALVSGSLVNVTSVGVGFYATPGLNDNAFTNIVASLTSTLQRFDVQKTTSVAGNTGVSPRMTFGVTNGATIDFTLRIGWPQLELGSFATSPIRTTSAAVQRAADVITVTSPPTFGSAYSLFAKAAPQAPVAYGSNQGILALSDGTTSNRFWMYRALTTAAASAQMTITTNTTPASSAAMSQSATYKLAAAGANNDITLSIGGAAAVSVSGFTFPSGVNQVSFSRGDGSLPLNGLIQQAAIWSSQRVPNAQLQSMTQ